MLTTYENNIGTDTSYLPLEEEVSCSSVPHYYFNVTAKQQRRQRYKKIARVTGIVLPGAATVAMSFVTVATLLAFNVSTPWMLILVGARAVVDFRTYQHDVPKAANVMFSKGISANLRNNLITKGIIDFLLKNDSAQKRRVLFESPQLAEERKMLYAEFNGVEIAEIDSEKYYEFWNKFINELPADETEDEKKKEKHRKLHKAFTKALTKALKKKIKRSLEESDDDNLDAENYANINQLIMNAQIQSLTPGSNLQNVIEFIKLNKHDELKTKIRLRKITFCVFSMGSAIGFGWAYYLHIATALKFIALLAGISLTGAAPIIILALAAVLALCAAMNYLQLMDRMISRAIENNIFLKLKKIIFKIFTPKVDLKTLQGSVAYTLKIACATVLVVFVVVASVWSALGNSDNIISSNINVLGDIINFIAGIDLYTNTAFQTVISALIYLSYLPTSCSFTLSNGLASIKFLVSGFNLSSIKDSAIQSFQEVRENPWLLARVPGYLLGFIIGAASLVLHAIAESSFAGEGFTDNDANTPRNILFINQLMDKITSFMAHIIGSNTQAASAAEVAVIIGTTSETLEHIPFVLGGDPDHGKPMQETGADASQQLIQRTVHCARDAGDKFVNRFSLFKTKSIYEKLEITELDDENKLFIELEDFSSKGSSSSTTEISTSSQPQIWNEISISLQPQTV